MLLKTAKTTYLRGLSALGFDGRAQLASRADFIRVLALLGVLMALQFCFLSIISAVVAEVSPSLSGWAVILASLAVVAVAFLMLAVPLLLAAHFILNAGTPLLAGRLSVSLPQALAWLSAPAHAEAKPPRDFS